MTQQDQDDKKPTHCTVKFSLGWLPSSVGFTDQAKAALADTLGVDRKIIRGSYAILGASKDKLIQEGTAIKRVLVAIRDKYTIPEFTLTSSSSSDGVFTERVKGSYLIETIAVDRFLKEFLQAREQYLAWGRRVAEPENYNRIRDADKQSLSQDWHVVERK